MTNLTIDTKQFKAVCARVRGYVADDFNAEDESIYAFYRWYVKSARKEFVGNKPTPTKAEMLHAHLYCASSAAYLYGATEAQIDYIVALATKTGNFEEPCGNRLTKREASMIIEDMKKGN